MPGPGGKPPGTTNSTARVVNAAYAWSSPDVGPPRHEGGRVDDHHVVAVTGAAEVVHDLEGVAHRLSGVDRCDPGDVTVHRQVPDGVVDGVGLRSTLWDVTAPPAAAWTLNPPPQKTSSTVAPSARRGPDPGCRAGPGTSPSYRPRRTSAVNWVVLAELHEAIGHHAVEHGAVGEVRFPHRGIRGDRSGQANTIPSIDQIVERITPGPRPGGKPRPPSTA